MPGLHSKKAELWVYTCEMMKYLSVMLTSCSTTDLAAQLTVRSIDVRLQSSSVH